MNTFYEAVGIDISKDTFDVCIYTSEIKKQFNNNKLGFERFLLWILTKTGYQTHEILFALEHTGHYCIGICRFFEKNNLSYSSISALQIKRSMGIVRGKDDHIDAWRISQYAYLRINEIVPTKLPLTQIMSIKKLLTARELITKFQKGTKSAKVHLQVLENDYDIPLVHNIYDKLIDNQHLLIKKIDAQLKKVVMKDVRLKYIFDLITSISCVGNLTAYHMIVATLGFTSFDTPNKFACHCGIAPFPYRSGTSVQGKDKVNHLANKRLKALIGNCAAVSLRYNQEIKEYYERKLKEGKHKMVIMNNIKNKIVHTIFAVVKRGTPYVEAYGTVDSTNKECIQHLPNSRKEVV